MSIYEKIKRFFWVNKEGAGAGAVLGLAWVLLANKIPAFQLIPMLFGLRLQEPYQSIVILSIFIVIGTLSDFFYKPDR